MSITLRPEHEQAVIQAIEDGAYESPDEVIARALEVLRSEDAWLRDHREEIQQTIERGLKQFEDGEYFSAEESRADMTKRKAVWLAEQKRDR